MKALIPLLLVSTSALAVTTVQFAHRAGTERKRADEALVVSQKHEARIQQLEKERSALDRELMEAQRPAMADVPAIPPGSRVASVLQRVGPPPVAARLATVRAEAVASSGATFGVQQWTPTGQSPAAQRYWQWQRKASTRRQYEGIGSALGLSREQENKLMDVLANQQVSVMSSMSDMKKRTEAEVAAVIGEDKLPQWQEYQQSIPERLRVNMVGEQMRQMDVPLTDEQRSRLVDIMVDQAQQNPRPTPQEGLPPEEMIKASMKWEEESDKAFLERAKSVLSADQYERYRDYQAWQSEMRANSIRYMQANGQNGGMVSFMRSPISADPPK